MVDIGRLVWLVGPRMVTHLGERGSGQQEVCEGEHQGRVDRIEVVLQSISLVHFVGLREEEENFKTLLLPQHLQVQSFPDYLKNIFKKEMSKYSS